MGATRANVNISISYCLQQGAELGIQYASPQAVTIKKRTENIDILLKFADSRHNENHLATQRQRTYEVRAQQRAHRQSIILHYPSLLGSEHVMSLAWNPQVAETTKTEHEIAAEEQVHAFFLHPMTKGLDIVCARMAMPP